MTGEKEPREPKDILGNHVETDRFLLERSRSSPKFRGSVAPLPAAAALEWPGCPSKAIEYHGEGASIDLGRCIMCGRCQEAAPEAFRMESGIPRQAKKRAELIVATLRPGGDGGSAPSLEEVGGQLRRRVSEVLGRSLAIREVDAGSCNGCEVEVSALDNPVYDVERFGIRFVASPRHADLLLVTGVASRNLRAALERTFEATPDPKVVVAVGACACSGGIFGESYASGGGIGVAVPVDVFVPGCPPRPEAILYGVLLAVDRVRAR